MKDVDVVDDDGNEEVVEVVEIEEVPDGVGAVVVAAVGVVIEDDVVDGDETVVRLSSLVDMLPDACAAVGSTL